MATNGRGDIHTARKRAFSGQKSEAEARLDVPNTNVQFTDVDWSAVGPMQYPEIHSLIGDGGSGGSSGGFVLPGGRPD